MRVLQGIHNNLHCEGMRTAEHTPGDPCRVLEHRHALADIVERGVGVQVERIRVKRPYFERQPITLAENALCHRDRSAQQFLGFFEAL